MPYSSSYTIPSEIAGQVLYSGNIIDATEKPHEMVERVVDALAIEETKFDSHSADFAAKLGGLMDSGKVVMSTPIMTNAGRYPDRPLSACTMPSVDIRASKAEIAKEISVLHQQGMGTGFNLSELDDPVEMLRFLNDKAVEGSKSGKEDRPVGNMAILCVGHPKIQEFVEAKLRAPSGDYQWKFNISVDVNEEFMRAVSAGERYRLDDGATIDASSLFDSICESAKSSADPGLIFMDRMNYRNPVPLLGEYKTTAPCAEVGLVAGESCQFGYINVGEFVSLDSSARAAFDYDGIYETARTMTRALDNALEVSISNYASARSVDIMSNKRKVGVGVCGIADAISMAGLAYDSDEARKVMLDVLALVNFASKEESIKLAEERGSCGAMMSVVGNRYYGSPGQIERLYGDLETDFVSQNAWKTISEQIKRTKMLRNISTIALPPTGRSALVIGASTGVEAHFTIAGASARTKEALLRHAKIRFGEEVSLSLSRSGFDTSTHDPDVAALFADATAISASGHLAMAATLQRATDEAISKTVNLPAGSTASDVANIYSRAHKAGMSGVTVYVNGTFGKLQPKKLDK